MVLLLLPSCCVCRAAAASLSEAELLDDWYLGVLIVRLVSLPARVGTT
jgi:hypothetical protein